MVQVMQSRQNDPMTGGDRPLDRHAFERLRKAVGLNQEELAALAGVSIGTVRNYENVGSVHDKKYDAMAYVLTELEAGRPVVFAAGVQRRGADRAGSFRGSPRDLAAYLRKAQQIVDRDAD